MDPPGGWNVYHVAAIFDGLRAGDVTYGRIRPPARPGPALARAGRDQAALNQAGPGLAGLARASQPASPGRAHAKYQRRGHRGHGTTSHRPPRCDATLKRALPESHALPPGA